MSHDTHTNPKLGPGQFCGRILKKRDVAGSILTEYSYLPDFKIPRHSHALPYFSIILKGAYHETSASKLRECKPAMLLFHPQGEVHADRFLNTCCRIFSFEIESQWVERAHQCSLRLNHPAEFSSGSPIWLALKLYGELYAMDEASPLVVEGLLLEVLAEIPRHKNRQKGPKPPRWLEQVKELLHANFTESLSLNVIAEAVQIHPTHVSREFRRYYSYSVGDYVRKLRIEFASREIAASDRPFFEIAVDAGFADHGHFTRTFKRLTGLTPIQYRTNSRSR